ncbi:MAG TPA: DUF4097 family beta strand repeat-containing protein [Thermoanaerobaculia bacterium]|jgi:DUF4097 and DUF4098 domain-containing protein YvlB|nr:DUF4097 family beta strand repeat-containing protein [Thermoanaerobaculia bacterium]
MRKLFLTFALFTMAAAASAGTLREPMDRTMDLRPGGEISLVNVNGKITITSWDQPRVRLQAEKYVESRDDEAAEKAMQELRIEVKATAKGISIETRQPNRGAGGLLEALFGDNINMGVRYELTVPRSVNLNVENTNGSVHVSELSGRLDLETTNGRIEVARCSGSVNAGTTNGAIHAELLQVASGASMHLETTNGGISLAIPSNLGASIEAGTTNGSVTTDVPITTTRFEKHSLRGTMNGGGPSIRLSTTNGSIKIAKVGT